MISAIIGGAVIGTLIGGAIKGLKDSMHDSKPGPRRLARHDSSLPELIDYNKRKTYELDKPANREINILSRKHYTDTENKTVVNIDKLIFIQHAHFHLDRE